MTPADDGSERSQNSSSADIRPIPDPTLLTTAQLNREIARLAESVDLKIFAANERLNAEVELTASKFLNAKEARDAIEKQLTTEIHALSAVLEERHELSMRSSSKAIEESVKLTNAKLSASAEVMTSLREMLNERYQTQTKALDAAFVAQQAAVATSFDASEKAMAAALLAAKEAVDKAAVSTEKRFDSVTELLAQQNSSMNLLLPRAEAEARIASLDARLTDIKSTVDKGFTGTDMRAASGKEYWGYVIGGLGLMAVIVNIIIMASGHA